MKYQKEIDWLRSKGVTGNNFKSDNYDDFTIGILAKRLNEYANEVNGVDSEKEKALHKQNVSIAERKLKAIEEVVDFFGDTPNTITRATMCDIINRL